MGVVKGRYLFVRGERGGGVEGGQSVCVSGDGGGVCFGVCVWGGGGYVCSLCQIGGIRPPLRGRLYVGRQRQIPVGGGPNAVGVGVAVRERGDGSVCGGGGVVSLGEWGEHPRFFQKWESTTSTTSTPHQTGWLPWMEWFITLQR